MKLRTNLLILVAVVGMISSCSDDEYKGSFVPLNKSEFNTAKCLSDTLQSKDGSEFYVKGAILVDNVVGDIEIPSASNNDSVPIMVKNQKVGMTFYDAGKIKSISVYGWLEISRISSSAYSIQRVGENTGNYVMRITVAAPKRDPSNVKIE